MSTRARERKPRRIDVEGVVYLYRVLPDDGFIGLWVRREGERGQRLRANFGYGDQWIPQGEGVSSSGGHRLILPGVVRLAILEGLRQGWMPSADHPGQFWLTGADGLLAAEDWPRFQVRSSAGDAPAAPGPTD